VLVSSDRIDLLQERSLRTLFKFESELVFAKTFVVEGREMLLCVGKTGVLSVFDSAKLKHDSLKQGPIMEVDLFRDVHLFDDAKPEHYMLAEDTPEEKQERAMAELKERFGE